MMMTLEITTQNKGRKRGGLDRPRRSSPARTPVILLSLLLASLHCLLPPVHGQPYSAEVKVAEIRFFQAGDEVPPKSQRSYSLLFPKSTTKIVYCQVEFINPLYTVESYTYQLSWLFLNPDGSVFKELEASFPVKVDTYIASYVKGVGWSTAGSWPLGTYVVHVFIGGKEIGWKEFTIYDDISSPGDVSSKGQTTPMNRAVYQGDLATVKALLEGGVDPNIKDKDGGYPLITAILRDQTEIVRLLLDHGANIQVADVKGRSAFMLAKFKQNSEIIQLLERAEQANISGSWVGKLTNQAGYLYDFTMNLSLAANSRVEGALEWIMKFTPKTSEQLKVGLAATEYVQGTYNPATREVIMNGSSKTDPYALISLGRYRFILLSDRKTVQGKASSDSGEVAFSATRKK